MQRKAGSRISASFGVAKHRCETHSFCDMICDKVLQQVAGIRPGFCTAQGLCRFSVPLLPVHEDLPLAVGGKEALLPVAVDAPVALLQPVRVPRDFVVDQPVAMVLEVQAFGGGIGGKQDATPD